MVENVEQIEAMLAAYIDGELTPDERAELERHLKANPSHRGLILELTGHRDLLRSLPREPAPEDLSEHLESAIERDALLGGGDPLTEFRTARTRRWWPQLLAAAAIFILAFGLAAIVFYVLPPKHPTVAIVQPPEIENDVEATRDEREQRIAQGMKEAVAEKDVSLAADAIAQSNARTAELGAETRTLMEASTAGGGGGGIAGGRATEALASAPTQDGTLVITITANDVQQASSELMTYFTTNGIAWSEPANNEAFVSLAKDVKSQQGDLDSVRLTMQGTPPPPAPTGGGVRNEPALEASSGVVQEVERVAPQDTAAASPAPPAPSQERATRERRAVARSAPAAAPTTSLARPSGGAEAVATQGLAGNTTGTSAGTSGTDRYVVLAALSGTQAERLASTFGRRAELRREAVAIPAVKQIAAPVASRPTRGLQVGLTTQEKLDEALRADATEFKLVRPATQPAVDPTHLWMLQDETLKATTTQPVEPFRFRVRDLGRELEGPVFNCVVVLRRPEEGGAATQPSTPVTAGATPSTQPAAGASR